MFHARFFIVLLLACAGAGTAYGQLFQVNSKTTIKSVGFKGNDTFEGDEIRIELATKKPTWKIPLITRRYYAFSPVELQKDVARIRRFYARRGFLQTQVDYVADFNAEDNQIRILFTIQEGPPLQLLSLDYVGPNGRDAFYQFTGIEASDWRAFRDGNTTVRTGDRLSRFEVLRIQDATLDWLQERGFAFADVLAEADIDTAANVADVQILIDAGPRGRVSDIYVEGNRSVSDNVVRRELPFTNGERYRRDDLTEGQRQLFGLNLFRLAIVDLPPQPRDSTVDVRVLVQEVPPRRVGAETGYSFAQGIRLGGELRHRNFVGGARNLTLAATWVPGRGAGGASVIQQREQGVSLTLEQPYLFNNALSGALTTFIEEEQQPAFQAFTYGVTSSLVYRFLTSRALTLSHTFAVEDSLNSAGNTRFTRSVFSFSGLVGRADDYLAPTQGGLIRPFVDYGSAAIGSDIRYLKAGLELTGYTVLSRQVGLAGRLFGGRLWPIGDGQTVDDITDNFRFNRIRFYGGGPNDVRGWNLQELGPIADAPVFDGNGQPRYRPLGATTKYAANLEVRLPFPGLPSEWQTAAFIDAARLRGNPIRAGIGGGIRYLTLIGFVRFDVGFKLNPAPHDLRDPEDWFSLDDNGAFLRERAETDFLRRFGYHLSIGYAF